MKSSAVDDEHLNFLIGIEKKLNDLLKELKASEAISKIDYKKRKPRSSSFGVLYGLCKTHEKVLDKCPLFGPILTTIKTPCYNLVKFLFLLIEHITKNILLLKIVLNSLRKYVNKILDTLWPVLTLSPFSPIYHWRKLLKSVVTNFIKTNCCVASVKISFKKLLRAALSNNYF